MTPGRRSWPLRGALVFAAPAAQAPAASGRILVGFEKGVSKERQQDILSAAGGRIGRRFAAIRGGRLATVRPRSGKATDALMKAPPPYRRGRVRRAGLLPGEIAGEDPNDPFYTLDYALVESPDDHDIDAPAAWTTRTGCAKVAILDTGIDTDHPDLASNVYKSSDKPNNGKDDDKNGYVDDTYGWNVINGKGSGEDDNGHGTHVSGIVAGRGTTRTASRGSAGPQSSSP